MNAPVKPKVLSAAATALPTATSMVLLLGSMLYSSDVVAQDPGALDGALQSAQGMDQHTVVVFFALQVVSSLAAALLAWLKTRSAELATAATDRDRLREENAELRTKLAIAELRGEMHRRDGES